MNTKNVKFEISSKPENQTAKMIGGLFACVCVGWLIGIGIAIASWMMPFSVVTQ
tara:strand:+ start:79 stop:240 length:162 start_codon:yes stop_codon:yes gene_type:complete